MTEKKEKFYFVKEVATQANRSVQTIKRWAKQGKVPSPKRLKASGRLVFSEKQALEIVKFASEAE